MRCQSATRRSQAHVASAQGGRVGDGRTAKLQRRRRGVAPAVRGQLLHEQSQQRRHTTCG
jgi:hypothetical protein